jgi:hypothetical protein
MSDEIAITPCVCKNAGYCERHQITKNPHFHRLCQTRQDYFNMYERCVGPGQEFTNCDGTSPVPPTILVEAPSEPCPACKESEAAKTAYTPPVAPVAPQMPSLWQQTKNLTKSVVEHVKTGAAEVTPEEKQARLDICNGCEFYNKIQGRCGKCGCNMPIKTGWSSAVCPLNPPKWGRGSDVK